jgi:hypothetical protein
MMTQPSNIVRHLDAAQERIERLRGKEVSIIATRCLAALRLIAERECRGTSAKETDVIQSVFELLHAFDDATREDAAARAK